jgi:hypothetical protein
VEGGNMEEEASEMAQNQWGPLTCSPNLSQTRLRPQCRCMKHSARNAPTTPISAPAHFAMSLHFSCRHQHGGIHMASSRRDAFCSFKAVLGVTLSNAKRMKRFKRI